MIKKGLSRLGELYIENGKKVWDGSIDAERNDFPRDLEQFRIVQYASCRGLEGWMVVNYAIDEQYQQLLKHPHIDQTRKNDLLFSQEKSQLAEHYAKKSIMIPFTRAIDTMFVHVSDPNSFIGSALLTLHKEHPEIFQLKAIEENTTTNRLEDLNKNLTSPKWEVFRLK